MGYDRGDRSERFDSPPPERVKVSDADLDYKNFDLLRKCMGGQGQMFSRRRTGFGAQRQRVRVEAEETAREAQISARIEALGKITLSVIEKADSSGTLYGSVGSATIVRLLAKAGVQADEKDIRLDEPIKSVGTHEIPI